MRFPDSENLRRFLESRISESKDLRSSDSQNQNLRFSDSQILRLSESRILRFSDSQILRFSESQILRISDSQILRISDSQKLRISESQNLTSLHVPKAMSRYPNRVAMAPHGLILGENEATPSKKLLKHLPDLKTAINIKQITKNSRSTAPAAGM